MGEEWVVARGLGQYLGYTKRGKTRRLAKRVSGGRKNDKTFTECGFSELRRGGNDQKIRAERKSALLIRKLRLVFDHTSVLKLTEWRWGLAPLTPRDASNDVQNLAYALNFSEP